MSAPAMPMLEEPQAAAPVDPDAEHKVKLKKLRGEAYPAKDAPEGIKSAYVKKLLAAGDADGLARYRQATKNICYHSGRMHIAWSNRSRSWEDLPLLDPNELRVVMNYIRPILRATTQRMLSAPVDFSVRPRDNSHEEKDRADVGARFLNSRWEQTAMKSRAEQTLELAFCCGVAAWKGFWNPSIGPLTPATKQQVRKQPMADPDGNPVIGQDGQPLSEVVYDAQGQPLIDEVFVDEQGNEVPDESSAYHFRPGDTDTVLRTVFNLRCNPEATGWDAGSGLRWVVDREVVPLSVAREKYQDIADRILAIAITDSSITYERIAASAATQRPVVAGTSATAGTAQKNDPGESTVITEYWELPNECYPQGRLIVLVGEVEAYDDVFPQGVFPYSPVYDEPAPLTAMGRPRVNDMTGPSDLINRQWTAIDAEMQMAGVGQWIAWDVEGVPDQITSSNRTVTKVPARGVIANKSLREVMHRIDPPAVGGDRWRIIDMAKGALFDIGGFHEVSRGQTPPGVDSGVAVKYLQEAEAGQLQKAMQAFHASIIAWARIQGQIAKWGYGDDTSRWMPVERKDLGFQVESVKGKDLPDFATAIIELDNFKPTSATSRAAELKELFEAQIIGPQQVLKAMDMGTGANALLDSQNRHYARARNENLAIQKGEFQAVPAGPAPLGPDGYPVGPPPMALMHADGSPFVLQLDDNHLLHMDIHDELVLDDSQPVEIRQAASAHKQEHRAAMQALQPATPPSAPPPHG